MSNPLQTSLDYAKKQHSHFIDQMCEWIAMPSISTDPAARGAMQQSAEFVAAYLTRLGVQNVQLFPPDSHPLVYGELLEAGPEAPTVLIYGHYDVQPATPLDKWHSDPFKPVIRGENLYARGATDMKGQVMATLYAIESLQQAGKLGVNLKFMIEGEEEIGSAHLPDFIKQNKDLLKSDFCLNPDTGMLAPGLPTLTYALRGLAYFELRVYGPKQDLHSGIYGGTVHNPAQALCELIAGMHDSTGKITLPNFYDRVRPLSQVEREAMKALPHAEELLLKNTGVPKLWGEPDFIPMERIGARPTLEVNGIYAGFIEKGSKTVLPAYAMAKLSTRLVPDQDPEEVGEQLRAYLEEHAPKTVRWELDQLASSAPSISDIESPWAKAMMSAQEKAWGVKPLLKREGGSVPVVTQLQQLMGLESVNIGFGLPDDNAHGPDEKLHLPTWEKGIEALIYFFDNLKP